MGDLLRFPVQRVRAPEPAVSATPSFCFDVSDPFSYLAAERVERVLGDAEWVAVDRLGLGARPRGRVLAQQRASAHRRADALRLPLVWPDRYPAPAPGALRAADLACELGRGPAFALAMGRLAFCGGFDLDDPEVLAEAAAAAGVPLGACLDAAGERWRDDALRERAVRLVDAGIDALPAFCVDGRWLAGEQGLVAVDAIRCEREPARHRLAPVG